jgi:hypothetical protein
MGLLFKMSAVQDIASEVSLTQGTIVHFIVAAVLGLNVVLSRKRSGCNVPGPKGSIYGLGDHSCILKAAPERQLRQWAMESEELFKVHFGLETLVCVNRREAIKAIFDKQSAATSCKRPLEHANEIVYGLRLAILPYGSNGEYSARRSIICSRRRGQLPWSRAWILKENSYCLIRSTTTKTTSDALDTPKDTLSRIIRPSSVIF